MIMTSIKPLKSSIFCDIPSSCEMISGQDMNASFASRTKDNTVGPNGIYTPNKKGKKNIILLKSFNFKTPLTYFKQTFKYTWRGFNLSNKNSLQIQFNSIQFVKDANVTDLGVPSDHSAIIMNVFFKRKRLKPKKLTTNIDWN